MTEAKVDTGATMAGIISSEYVELLSLSPYLKSANNVVEVANGVLETCTRIVDCFVMTGGEVISMQFIVLKKCKAGLLLGQPALKKLGIDRQISALIQDKNSALRDTISQNVNAISKN